MNSLVKNIITEIGKDSAVRFLVVGSKPKFTFDNIGRFDVGFFANAAISRKDFFDIEKTYNIIAETVYTESTSSQLARVAWELVDKYKSQNCVVVQGPGWIFRSWVPRLPNFWGQVCGISVAQKRSVIAEVLGLRWMLASMWSLSPGIIPFIKDILRLALRGQGRSMKPSTGVWSVLFACYIARKLLPKSEIIVSGIGLVDDGYSYADMRTHRSVAHGIDSYVIKHLSNMGVRFLDMEK